MPAEMKLKYDRIGSWSIIKLEIIRDYAKAYSEILSTQRNPSFYHVYIDAFAGPGKHVYKDTGEFVPGSPQIALDINPPFKEYYFIDIDGDKVAELNEIVSNRPEAHVLEGDCNPKLLTEVFPRVMYEDYRRGLCLLDPYGLDLNWEVIKTAGQMGSIEIFLNFPVMDMNRNVFWSNPEDVDPTDISRMNAFWGDDSWKEVAYRPTLNLFGEVREIKESNRTIALTFRERLQEIAEFKHVSQPLPMRNTKGATIYYLYFASQQQVADDIIRHIFNRYRNRGMK